MKAGALLTILALGAASGCGSAPKPADEGPAWTRQPTRTVDAGYIVYVGQGEDRSPDKARFKAESMALQDLANECSLAPKGTRFEDHYDSTVGVVYRSFAKAAVEFQDCESARKAVTPEQIRAVANATMTEQLKRYQDLVDEPENDEQAPLVAANDALSNTSNPPMPRDEAHFYIVRQQLAFAKEVIILAPPAQYPPQAPVTTQPVPAIVGTTNGLGNYVAAHPEIRNTTTAFSSARPNSYEHRPEALRETKAERARVEKAYSHPGSDSRASRSHGKSISGGGKKKKRSHRNHDEHD